MNYIQLFAQTQGATGSTEYVELDLYEADPIKMNKSVQDLLDPGVATSAYSQNFRIPATDTNTRYFKAVFNVNVENYDPTLKANAYINIQGEYYTGGSIRLVKVYTNGRKSINEFEIGFLGETRTFAGEVGGKFLSDLDFSALAHDRNFFNIVISWNANVSTPFRLFGGDIVYPLVELGYNYGPGGPAGPTGPIQSTLSVFNPIPGTEGQKGFTNAINPLSQTQFLPALRIKRIWDQIFKEVGYTYESNFITNENYDFFNRLYYMGTSTADAEFSGAVEILRNPWAGIVFNGSFVWNKLNFTTFPRVLDTYNAYQTDGNFVSPNDFLSFRFQINLTYDYRLLSGGTLLVSYRIRRIRNNITTTVGQVSYPGVVSSSSTPGQVRNQITNIDVTNILAGDIYFPEINVNFFGDLRLFRIWGSEFKILATPDKINVSSIFPNDQYTQIDFLRALTKKFNLVWEPDPDNANNFYIEPWNDWIGRGIQTDWTAIIDEDKDLDVEPLFYTQPRTLIYKDAEEADVFNFSYQQETKQSFGQLNLESPIEIISGESKIETFFAPTPLAPIGNSNTFLIPHFAKDTETERQPIQVKPRLLFYNGFVPNPPSIPTWHMETDGGAATSFSSYPLVSNFNQYPFDGTAFDINWTNSKQFWQADLNQGNSGQTSFTAYTQFWQTWYEATYSKFSRKLVAEFVLGTRDLKNLRFNDLIFIKDAWYIPTKYTDFSLGYKQKVKVELVKYWPPLGINIGSTGPGAGPQLFAQPNLCFGISICQACCCQGLRVTLFTDNRNLDQSNFAFATATGILPASGFYSDGTNYYEVSESGAILSVGNCEICDCSPVIVESLIETPLCYGDSPCEAYCCEGATGNFYIETTGLSGATQIFSTPEAAPAEINTWFSDGITIYLTGEDGFSVVQQANDDDCDCFQLEEFGFYGFGTGITGACCIQGVTGSAGINSVFYDNPDFLDSSAFFYDSTQTLPVGPTGVPVFISNGEYYITATEGNAGATGDCTGITCDNRTLEVQLQLVNETGTSVELSATGFICYDLTNFFYAYENVSSGGPFTDTYSDFYAPGTLFQYTAVPDTAGDVTASVIEDGNILYSETQTLSAFQSFTTPSFAINANAWEVIFTWEP